MAKKIKTISLILSFVILLSLAPGSLIVTAVEKVLSVLVESTLVFQDVYYFNDRRAIAYTIEDNPVIINETGEVVYEIPFSYAYGFFNGFAIVGDGGIQNEDSGWWIGMKYGLINTSGEVVVEPIYDGAYDISEGLACVGVRTELLTMKWGLVDTSGAVVVDPKYDSIGNFIDGLARVAVGQNWNDDKGYWDTMKYGVINEVGNEIVPPIYESISDFFEGFARVSVRDNDTEEIKFGVIDKTGTEVVQPIYDEIGSYMGYFRNEAFFCDGLARVGLGDSYMMKWGFVDVTGNVVVPIQYDKANIFSEGFAVVGVGEYWNDWGWDSYKYGFIDTTGTEIVKPKYDNVYDFSEGLARVGMVEDWRTMKYGFVDKNGDEAIKLVYDTASDFSEGYARIGVGEDWNTMKHGFIDKDGTVVVQPIYDEAENFSEGIARVGIGAYGSERKYGFISTSGNVVAQIKYDYAESLIGGFAKVGIGGKYGAINTAGHEVVPLIYDYYTVYNQIDDLIIVNGRIGDNNKWGILDRTGRELLPLEYDDISIKNYGFLSLHGIYEDLFWVHKGGLYGIAELTTPLSPASNTVSEGLEDALAGGVPIVLAENASTAITTDDLAKIKDQSGILQIMLPSGQLISIDPAAITENARAIDLNIGLAILDSATTIHGVVIPINTIIITPAAHGGFGFTINIEVSKEQIAAAGLSGADTYLFYINASGGVIDYGKLLMNADGSATIPISNASCYVLSDEILRSAPGEEPLPTDAEFLQERAAAIRKNGLSQTQLVLSANNKATLTLRIDGKDFVIATNVNNRNVSGRVVLPDGSGVLIFDIKGNGSNIKTFEVVFAT